MLALSLVPSYPGRALRRHLAFSRRGLKGVGIVSPLNNLVLDADSTEIRDTEPGDNFS